MAICVSAQHVNLEMCEAVSETELRRSRPERVTALPPRVLIVSEEKVSHSAARIRSPATAFAYTVGGLSLAYCVIESGGCETTTEVTE
jgi:hypothetical protein